MAIIGGFTCLFMLVYPEFCGVSISRYRHMLFDYCPLLSPTWPCSSCSILPQSSSVLPVRSSCPTMMRLPASWPCFSKANARDWVPLRPLVNSVILNNAIFSSWNTLKLKARWPCKAKHAAQRPIIVALRRWCARSFVTASWIRMLRLRLSLKSSNKLTTSLAFAASSGSSATLVCKKKLYACRPRTIPQQIQTQRTQRKKRLEPCDPASLQREVRQLLADKISGNQVGIWLLAPEHLRLGTWDLLCASSQCDGQTLWPRMALHLVHEAALCVSGRRRDRSLTQKGFELSNGLPFVPTDSAMHELLKCHTIAEAQALQVALGKIRRASGHFQGRLLAIDPHRIKSSTKRQMRQHR